MVNQLATPGLGSLMGKRWIAGLCQIILSVTGCLLLIVWFFKVMYQYYGQITGDVKVQAVGWMGGMGAILFAAAWFWALATSMSLIREARKNQNIELSKPPRLS